MSALDDLLAHIRTTAALKAVAERTGWDQETMMPAGAAAQRGEEMAALETVIHSRDCDPRIGDWLDRLPADLDEAQSAQVREIRRTYLRAQRVPGDLAAALARATSLSQGKWADARAAENFAGYAPCLTEVVALKREEAAALADKTAMSPYDALLDDFEPATTSADLTAMFDRLRPRLVALSQAIAGSARKPSHVSGQFGPERQLALSRQLAVAFGYDLNRGRIDRSVHPFSSGAGADVRITTRIDFTDPFNCIYSTIHETGHACYEQNIAPELALTAIGRGASMGVHESQSRLYENQIGRSRAFTGWLFEEMRASFGAFGLENPEEFYGTVNRVEAGFIRTEADEVHYNLHVMLRYALERDLIAGRLEVRDLEEAWNSRFAEDFGLQVPKPSFGVLQDVHWPVGLFGYFPTYTLGNVFAACLFQAMRSDLGDLEAEFSAGRLSSATDWLADHVHRHGASRQGRDTILHATGQDPEEGPLLAYLEEKFGALYGL